MGLAAGVSNDQVWYFFCKRELKYKNASRPRFNRSTDTGHWKPTGSENIVKAKGSNKTIGTKRTLVFYIRGAPREIKTNWVIHEYQPKSILPHQKDFVLCKLKEKGDGKADSSGSDQAESSRNNNRASDHHPVELSTPQEVNLELLLQSFITGNEKNFENPSAMQPQIRIEEQGISLDDIMFNDVFDNDSDVLSLQFDNNEPQVDLNQMADSFIVVPDEQSGEEFLYPISADSSNRQENASTHLNSSCSPQSMIGVYLDDINETDAGIAYGNSIPFGASSLNNGQTNSKAYRQTQRVQTITETLPPSTYIQSGKEKNHFHRDEILVMEASCSSADSKTGSSEEINSIGVANKESPIHTRTRTHQKTESGNITVKKELLGKMSARPEHKAREARKNDNALNLCRESKSTKENITAKTEKDQKYVNAKTNMKLRDNSVTGNKKTGTFIRMETSLLSQGSSPPSFYIFNVIIGLILLIAAIRELLILH
ncbi:protein NTM1-like 9 isoform X2 [Jatropha curcas]|uniref:protein NTM1-like 9 isoform X2 n=1 Tax=Jatropha curcas TaxID=180498 RepID=UPI0009D69A2F|nr:protein NTM1-like 9 isoform X2 [Jatropha curcas]